MVGRSQDGPEACKRSGGAQLLAWLGPIDRRDFRRGLLPAPPRDDLQDRLAEAAGDNYPKCSKRDLENPPDAPLASPRSEPIVINRGGKLAPGQLRTLPFTFVGPDRRATFTATVNRVNEQGARVRLELTCGSRTFVKRLRAGQRTATIDRRNLGPADCQIALRSTSENTLDYKVRLRLAA